MTDPDSWNLRYHTTYLVTTQKRVILKFLSEPEEYVLIPQLYIWKLSESR